MSRQQKGILANSVNGCTDIKISVATLGMDTRGLQSGPDRHPATAESNIQRWGKNSEEGNTDINNNSHIGEPNDFGSFVETQEFSGFNESFDCNRLNYALDFSGFSDSKDFSGFNISKDISDFNNSKDFSGFNNSKDFSGFSDKKLDSSNDNNDFIFTVKNSPCKTNNFAGFEKVV